ncbi:hypothetical protein ACFL6D_00575 [Spirochaetota bacterium]
MKKLIVFLTIIIIFICILNAKEEYTRPTERDYFSFRRLYPVFKQIERFEIITINRETRPDYEKRLLHNDKKVIEISMNKDATKIAVTYIIGKFPKVFYISPVDVYMQEFSYWSGVRDETPLITSDGNTIFFVSDRYQNREIYKIDVPKEEIDFVVDNMSHNYNPTINEDGSIIGYVTTKDRGKPLVFVLDRTTGKEVVVSMPDCSAKNPKLSSDGDYIAYSADDAYNNSEVYFASIKEKYIINISDNFKIDDSPDLSRAGKRIVFHTDRTGDYDIFMLDRDAKEIMNLTQDKKSHDRYPMISDDGNIVVYEAGEKWLTSSIKIINIRQKKIYRLYELDEYKTKPLISKDGKNLIYASNGIYFIVDLNKLMGTTRAPAAPAATGGEG